jgi:hypothetical protein
MEKDGVEFSQTQQFDDEQSSQAIVKSDDDEKTSDMESEEEEEQELNEDKEFKEVADKIVKDEPFLYMRTMQFLVIYERTKLDSVLGFISRMQKNQAILDETFEQSLKENDLTLSHIKGCILCLKDYCNKVIKK